MFVKGNPVDREPMVAFDIDGVLVADLAPWAANDKGLVGCHRKYEALDDFYRRQVNEQRPLFTVRDPFIAITGRQHSPSSEQWLFSTQPQCAGVHFYDVGGDFSQESLIAHKRMALARTNVRRFWESNPRKVAAYQARVDGAGRGARRRNRLHARPRGDAVPTASRMEDAGGAGYNARRDAARQDWHNDN